MKNLFNKNWWIASSTRALKTVCQTAVGCIGASTLLSEIDIKVVLSASILAGITSLLTSIAGLPEVRQEAEYYD